MISLMKRIAAILLLLQFSIGPSPAEAARKQALLIANAGYPVKQLLSPEQDAQALAEKLSEVGFEVRAQANLNKFSMRGVVSEFVEQLQPGDIAFFYFSGYGLSSLGQTFLMPVDAQIERDIDIWQNGLSVKTILKWIVKNSPGAVVVAIDAARNHPSEKLIRAKPAGLEPDIGTLNTLTIYSAAPGQILDDEVGGPSLFGTELAAQIAAGDLDATDAFNRVRINVARGSNGRQVPLVTSTLARSLKFSDAPPAGGTTPGSIVTAGLSRQPVVPARTGDAKLIQDCAECPRMVIVPAGSFEMGADQPYRGPPHSVTIRNSFAIGQYEVTFAEWDACAKDKGCDKRPQDLAWGRDTNPVINVSWFETKQYLKWLSDKTGKTYRLPSEAEWEYAARAGTEGPYWWGAAIGAKRANCAGCKSGNEARPRKVGSFAANPFGLYDTSGNVAEWVEDCWNGSYDGAPADGSAWIKGECGLRVLRGGSYDSGAKQVQSSFRFRYDAYVPYSANGFRVVRELE